MQTSNSIVPKLDVLFRAAASSCALVGVRFYLFVGAGELGLCPCRFFIGMEDDQTYILTNSSIMVTDLMGESLLLEISTVSGLLCILR